MMATVHATARARATDRGTTARRRGRGRGRGGVVVARARDGGDGDGGARASARGRAVESAGRYNRSPRSRRYSVRVYCPIESSSTLASNLSRRRRTHRMNASV